VRDLLNLPQCFTNRELREYRTTHYHSKTQGRGHPEDAERDRLSSGIPSKSSALDSQSSSIAIHHREVLTYAATYSGISLSVPSEFLLIQVFVLSFITYADLAYVPWLGLAAMAVIVYNIEIS